MTKFLVTPVDTTKRSFTVEAEVVNKNIESGALEFRDADGNLVAQVYNASFRRK